MTPETLTADFFPLDSIVGWVHLWGTQLGIERAWDRPWYYSSAGPQSTPAGHALTCRCGTRVWMRLHETQNKGHLWLGQCASCQAILWHVPQ